MRHLEKVFSYQEKEVRVVIKDGFPWWVAKDVCEVLGLEQVTRAISRLYEDEVTTIKVTDSLGRKQETNIINEPGLYTLILGSKKQEAKAFKRWITHEVIPSIRKTGQYQIQDVKQQVTRSRTRINEKEKEAKRLLKILKDHKDVITSDSQQTILSHVTELLTGKPLVEQSNNVDQIHDAHPDYHWSIIGNKIQQVALQYGINVSDYPDDFDLLEAILHRISNQAALKLLRTINLYIREFKISGDPFDSMRLKLYERLFESNEQIYHDLCEISEVIGINYPKRSGAAGTKLYKSDIENWWKAALETMDSKWYELFDGYESPHWPINWMKEELEKKRNLSLSR